MKALAFQEVLDSPLLQATIKRYIGTDDIDVVPRPLCYILRNKTENKKVITRIIVLKPHGYTADALNLMNPHPEAYKARIKILGKVDPSKKGYKPCLDVVKLNYSNTVKIPTQKSSAYAVFSESFGGSKLLPWKNWVYVVKKNRWGDFHNIINQSNEWVVVLLEKWLVDQKSIVIDSYLKKLPAKQAEKLKRNLKIIQVAGDEIFENEKLVEEVLQVPSEILIPILIRMLNISETGRHESCTFFAFLLKASRNHKALVLHEVNDALKNELAPYYYLEDLLRKIK